MAPRRARASARSSRTEPAPSTQANVDPPKAAAAPASPRPQTTPSTDRPPTPPEAKLPLQQSDTDCLTNPAGAEPPLPHAESARPAAMPGLLVTAVDDNSSLAQAGLRPGDRIVAIDGLLPRDVIDLQLELPAARRVTLERRGHSAGPAARPIVVSDEPDGAPQDAIELRPHDGGATCEDRPPSLRFDIQPPADGMFEPAALQLAEAVPGGIRECNNHCEFCFIRGLPKGLRPTLYVFDDDYRYSFLLGNFLPLTNLDAADWARIGFQRLSPLNVSVHATDPAMRRRMLNNRHAPDILPQIDRLGRLGIQINAQVVLCAGLNDGAVLEQTIDELARRYPTVHSLSVVPVGLTAFSKVNNIRRPSTVEAAEALTAIERRSAALRQRLGVGFVYGSDELYVLAGRSELPPAEAYDGFPVLTNGVGLLRSMVDTWDRLLAQHRARPARTRRARTRHAATEADRARGSRGSQQRGRPEEACEAEPTPADAAEPSHPNVDPERKRKVVLVTGRLAAPALEHIAAAWAQHAGWRPTVRVVDNGFFGDAVTVSGLLTGQDLIRTLAALPSDVEDVVLPSGAFGFDGQATLDGVSAEAVGAAHPGRVHLAASPAELLAIFTTR